MIVGLYDRKQMMMMMMRMMTHYMTAADQHSVVPSTYLPTYLPVTHVGDFG